MAEVVGILGLIGSIIGILEGVDKIRKAFTQKCSQGFVSHDILGLFRIRPISRRRPPLESMTLSPIDSLF